MNKKRYWLRGLIVGIFVGWIFYIVFGYMFLGFGFVYLFKITIANNLLSNVLLFPLFIITGGTFGIIGLFAGFFHGKINKQKNDLPRNTL